MVPGSLDLAFVASQLRARRRALQPEHVGLPRGRRRRTPGLRREEAAALCAMSPAYYGRLERHCGPRPSPITLAHIARGLRFSDVDRDRLFIAAGYDPERRSLVTTHLAAPSMHVLDRLADTPALAVDALGGVLHQTAAAAALFGAATDHVGWDRSAYYRWFTSPHERDRFEVAEHPTIGAEIAAELRRAVQSEHLGAASDLVRLMQRRSGEFTELWRNPGPALDPTRRCRVVHRELGVIELNREVLCESDFRLVIYTAAPESKVQLELATVLGHHRFDA